MPIVERKDGKDYLFEVKCSWRHPSVTVYRTHLDSIVIYLQTKAAEHERQGRSLDADQCGAVIEVLNDGFGTRYQADPYKLKEDLPLERQGE